MENQTTISCLMSHEKKCNWPTFSDGFEKNGIVCKEKERSNERTEHFSEMGQRGYYRSQNRDV